MKKLRNQTGKVALVTGDNRRIGFETCRQLAQIGFRVLLTSRDGKKGKNAAAELHDEGLDIDYHRFDVSQLDHNNRMRKFVVDNYRRHDALINNAGITLNALTRLTAGALREYDDIKVN